MAGSIVARVTLSASGSAATQVKREKVEGAVEVEYQTTSGSWTAESLRPVLDVRRGSAPAVPNFGYGLRGHTGGLSGKGHLLDYEQVPKVLGFGRNFSW
jgi:hypothetical protein